MTPPETSDCNRDAMASFAAPHGSAIEVQRISKFLRVVSDAYMPDERGIISNDNELIGIIGYYKPWREWVLYPDTKTFWSADCLVAIKEHLARMSSPNPKLSDGPASKQ